MEAFKNQVDSTSDSTALKPTTRLLKQAEGTLISEAAVNYLQDVRATKSDDTFAAYTAILKRFVAPWMPLGRAWVADSGTSAVSLFAPTGLPVLTPPATGGGLNLPSAIALDGNGTAWVANATGIAQIPAGNSAPTTPATGLGTLNQPLAIAVDGSGNIWTANSGDNSVSVFVGLAAPVATPLAVRAGP